MTLVWTASLTVLVDGANYTGTEFCVGDNITFICAVPSVAHEWIVPAFDITNGIGVVIRNTVPKLRGTPKLFTLALVENLTTSIISSLSVVAFPMLDETVITCADITGMSDDRTATAIVMGKTIELCMCIIIEAI